MYASRLDPTTAATILALAAALPGSTAPAAAPERGQSPVTPFEPSEAQMRAELEPSAVYARRAADVRKAQGRAA